MNMSKSNGGFTLVELIVVIAILAILAGVAVPAYTGYIKKAQEAADLQTLSAVYTAAAASVALQGDVEKIIVAGDTVTITPTPTDTTAFATFFAGNDIPDNLKAEWAGGTWKITQASSTTTE